MEHSIDREKVIAWLADEELYYRDHGDTHNSLMACDALALLKEQEAEISKISNAYLELVGKASKQPEIVRCKDCIHWDELTQACDEIDGIFLPDWYCADGEAKT